MINNDWYIDDRSHLGSSEKLEGRSSDTVTEISRMSHSWPVTKNDVMIKEVLETRKSRTVFHKIKGAMFPALVIILILGLVITLFFYGRYMAAQENRLTTVCTENCRFQLVEEESSEKTVSSLFLEAKSDVFVMTSSIGLNDNTDIWLLDERIRSHLDKLNIGIAVTNDSRIDELGSLLLDNNFTEEQMSKFKPHPVYTQFILVDNSSFYMINSKSNQSILDKSRPSSGYVVLDCQCLAGDLMKVYNIYYQSTRGTPMMNTLKKHWYFTNDGVHTDLLPLRIQAQLNNSYSQVGDFHFVSESPLILPGVQSDVNSIIQLLNSTTKYLYILVSSYNPGLNGNYWSKVDDVLRKVIYEEKVRIRFLTCSSRQSKYIRALPTINTQMVEYRNTNTSSDICYLITESSFLIGSCDWSGDYFMKDRFSVSLIGKNMTDSLSRDDVVGMDIRTVLKDHFDSRWSESDTALGAESVTSGAD